MKDKQDKSFLIIGVGGVGCRMAMMAQEILNLDCLLISDKHSDLHPDHHGVFLSLESMNELSVNTIRSKCMTSEIIDVIKLKLADYVNVIIFGNLANKLGCAMMPILTWINNDLRKEIITFAILPFQSEQNKIFSSSVALTRLKKESLCVIILDNDSMRICEPNLNLTECFELGDLAIKHVIKSLSNIIDSQSLITNVPIKITIENSLKNKLDELYNSKNTQNKPSIIYVVGVEIPRDILHSVYQISNSNDYNQILNTDSNSHTVLLSTINNTTKFDKYDPLSILNTVLDWDEPECTLDKPLNLQIPMVGL